MQMETSFRVKLTFQFTVFIFQSIAPNHNNNHLIEGKDPSIKERRGESTW